MSKYKISREFFPFSHFTPPISEKFLAMAVPHMETPKYIYKDKELDVSQHEIESYDGAQIECFVMSPKTTGDNSPCLLPTLKRRSSIVSTMMEFCMPKSYAQQVSRSR